MSDYIKRQDVEEMLENAQMIDDGYGEYCGYCTADVNIDAIPAADVAPVATSEWEADGDYLLCARCGVRVSRDLTFSDVGELNYCPNCGAKIRTED